jgi:hypothetical protein
VKRIPGAEALQWLEERDPGGAITGYDLDGWNASVWILHAMYETNDLPVGISHDDIAKIELAAQLDPSVTRRPIRDAVPQLDWKRLSWVDLAKRLDVELTAGDRYPTLNPLLFESWPINIDGPDEGSLDEEQLAALWST